MISLTGVSRAFTGRSGTVEALREIDLEVRDGEFVDVIGRSGCGKSTLLRLVAGLLPDVRRGPVRASPVTGPRRDVVLMFQRPALLPWRSVLANVMLPVRDRRLAPGRERRARPRTADDGRPDRVRAAAAARAVRRHAAAGGAVPRADRRDPR